MSAPSNINDLSTRVVETVAACEQVSPLRLSPPLASFVDPDALDSLFERGNGVIRFDAWGYRITAAADGSVAAEANEREATRSVTDDYR
ncbi:HalOD1 output domain-containing protein [Halomarina oriensis]|uniref:Halobacterial output domain-containing protein n=1 Tax=Halomarina oriensis TaxID=671145 RepID=A0A6B0GG33_9EURY|nr:HalOD1 output domain-containing protein [Halomarina oriensis]MWG33896.1 hypothetical protein [Halomarina oriensis]